MSGNNLRMVVKNKLQSNESTDFFGFEQATLIIDIWHTHWTLFSLSQCRSKIAW